MNVISILWVMGCTKDEVVGNHDNIVADTVYVTNSKIYKDSLYVSDSLKNYILKYNNPVISQNSADPSVIRADNGIFYLYSTESVAIPNVPIYKSIDLINWFFVGTAFTDATRPTSFEGNIWAPDINYINDQYVLYYSMSKWGGEWDCGIGVAVAEYPWGPFREYAKLFDSRQIGVRNSIDPFYFEDGDEKFLFWGSHGGIFGIQLSDDGLSIKEGVEKFQIAGRGGEGTYIHRRDGKYYLFQSFGSCCNGLSSTYNIRIGRADKVRGPYYDRMNNPMLQSTGTLLLQGNAFAVGTGHNAELITDDNGVDWIIYHGFLKSSPELDRIIFLDRIDWESGWPFIQGYGASSSSEIPFFNSFESVYGNSN